MLQRVVEVNADDHVISPGDSACEVRECCSVLQRDVEVITNRLILISDLSY